MRYYYKCKNNAIFVKQCKNTGLQNIFWLRESRSIHIFFYIFIMNMYNLYIFAV